MQKRKRRYLFSILIVVLALVLLAAIPSTRFFFLRIPARALVIPEPAVKPVDVIVLTVDAYRPATLDAADLVHRGIATRVAVFSEPPDLSTQELIRRGVKYPDQEAVVISYLNDLGIHNVESIPTPVTGSEREGTVLPAWCERNHIRSLILVVGTDHARRVNRIMRRGFKGHNTTVTVYPTRYSDLNPEAWWNTRRDSREVIVEFEKLMLDVIRHPLS